MIVVVTVGSDHHPFDRLIRWVDDWAERHSSVDVWMQYGSSRPPQHAPGSRFCSHEDLIDRVSRATAVVSSAGPGTAMEIREAGLRPILVPRRASLLECVDDHQRSFARRMASQGMAISCERAEEVWRTLDQALLEPSLLHLPGARGSEPAARGRVGELVDELVERHRG